MAKSTTEDDQTITIRLPKKLVARMVKLIPLVAERGITITRADVVRIALLRGVEALELAKK